jgi:hypothetical protein
MNIESERASRPKHLSDRLVHVFVRQDRISRMRRLIPFLLMLLALKVGIADDVPGAGPEAAQKVLGESNVTMGLTI